MPITPIWALSDPTWGLIIAAVAIFGKQWLSHRELMAKQAADNAVILVKLQAEHEATRERATSDARILLAKQAADNLALLAKIAGVHDLVNSEMAKAREEMVATSQVAVQLAYAKGKAEGGEISGAAAAAAATATAAAVAAARDALLAAAEMAAQKVMAAAVLAANPPAATVADHKKPAEPDEMGIGPVETPVTPAID